MPLHQQNPLKTIARTRMRKLDASPAEGEERLREKNEVIDYCASAFPPDL